MCSSDQRPGHATHHRQRVLCSRTAMFACSRLAHAQFGVLTATPMNCKHDVTCIVVHINDDIDNQCSQQMLTCAHGYGRGVPRCRQVARQIHKGIRSDLNSAGLLGELARLQLFDASKCLLPAPLQLCSDETIVRITRCVAAIR
jgi:hypothetical protein